MSKQISFYAIESDKNLIAEYLRSVFGELLDIPPHKGLLSPFDINVDKSKIYLIEATRRSDAVYWLCDKSDGSKVDVLDFRESPVLEYEPASVNKDEGYYIGGRFYCCSNDQEFVKNVSRFFSKLKRNFWYVKQGNKYVSKNIDLSTAKFANGKIITMEDIM